MIDYDPRRWLSVALHVRGSVVPRLAPRLVQVTAIGALAQYLHVKHAVAVAPLTHSLLGVVLGLLLVFRTNASYDRWWEGRRLLGGMVNRTRDLARQATGYVRDVARSPASALPAEREPSILRRHIAAYFVLACQGLRQENDLAALGPLLTPSEKALLEPRRHRANVISKWITLRLAANVKAGGLTEQRLQLMDANLSAFNDYIGGCERILKTPLPLAYAQHTKLLVTLFCYTIPFALVDSLGWLTPIASGLLALGLIGVDEIGVEIEDPFGHDANDLPLEAIGLTIDRDTEELIDAAGDVPPMEDTPPESPEPARPPLRTISFE
jgi:putative membrane protein